MADREQALLELSLREIYAKTTLFYYGEPATPPSAESTPRPVTPPKLSIVDLEDGEIDEDGDLTPDARRSEAPTPRRGLRSWEIAERAPAPPPRSPERPRKRRRRRALSSADDGVVVVIGDDSGGISSDDDLHRARSL